MTDIFPSKRFRNKVNRGEESTAMYCQDKSIAVSIEDGCPISFNRSGVVRADDTAPKPTRHTLLCRGYTSLFKLESTSNCLKMVRIGAPHLFGRTQLIALANCLSSPNAAGLLVEFSPNGQLLLKPRNQNFSLRTYRRGYIILTTVVY